jgi:hypothetical protein
MISYNYTVSSFNVENLLLKETIHTECNHPSKNRQTKRMKILFRQMMEKIVFCIDLHQGLTVKLTIYQ